MTLDEYIELDALAMAEGLREGRWRSLELAECAIALAERLNPSLNAITTPSYEQARRQAAALDRLGPGGLSGRLAGVPFLIKETSAVAGLPHHHHSHLFEGEVAEADALIVSAFKQADVVSVGTTNTPEHCLTITTESRFAGPCHNPWQLDHSTGGSSGGSASAVAARIVPLAHGSDGGGSIRIPAACCGLFGLKVSRGLTPVEPHTFQSWSGFSVAHVLTRSVRDSAAMLDSIRLTEPLLYPMPAAGTHFLAELEQAPQPLRIALHTTHPNGGDVDPQVLAALDATAQLCRDLGHRVTEAGPPVDYPELARHFGTITNVHTAQVVQPQLERRGLRLEAAPLEAATRRMVERGLEVSGMEFAAALDGAHLAAQQMASFHRQFDVLLSPVTALPPVPLGWLDMDSQNLRDYGKRFGAYSGFCALYNATGQPSMSVPLMQSPQGLPLGMMFSAAWGADGLLLRLARQLEQALPWASRHPPLLDTALN